MRLKILSLSHEMIMKIIRLKALYAPVALAILITAGCSGGSGNTPPNKDLAMAESFIGNPQLMLKVSPLEVLNPISVPVSISSLPSVPGKVTFPDGALKITVAQLESDYEAKLCQLNDAEGIKWNNPECQSNIAFIKQQPGTGNIDLNSKPIQNNSLGVTGVVFQPVNYSTTVTLPNANQPETINVSGGILLPQGITGNQIKGVVTYYHGTAMDKAEVGSNYLTNSETQLMAEVFASQGYIVVIPDYVGQGIDWARVHPYVLYPQVSVKTAVDMLNAVDSTLRSYYQLGTNSLKLFTTGFSEGGGYSLWSSVLMNRPGYTLSTLYRLQHSMGIAGAFNTGDVMNSYFFSDVSRTNPNSFNISVQMMANATKPTLGAVTLLSYATYSLNGDMSKAFNPSFYALDCDPAISQSTCNVDGQHVNIYDAFLRPSGYQQVLPIMASASQKSLNGETFCPPNLYWGYASSSKNNMASLVSSDLASPSGRERLQAALTAANVDLSSLPDGAVSTITLNRDSLVTPNNATKLQSLYPTKLRDAYFVPNEKLQILFPYLPWNQYIEADHSSGVDYELLYVLNTFNQF